MDFLERNFDVKSLPNFIIPLRDISREESEFIKKFADFKIVITEGSKVPDANCSKEVTISWRDMCSKTDAFVMRKYLLNEGKNGLSTLNCILNDKKWGELYSIIGTALMDFILMKAILLRFAPDSLIYYVINRDYDSYSRELNKDLKTINRPKALNSIPKLNGEMRLKKVSASSGAGSNDMTKANSAPSKPESNINGLFLSINFTLYSQSQHIFWCRKSFLFSKKPTEILKELFEVKNGQENVPIREDEPKLDDLKSLMHNVALLHKVGLHEKIIRKSHVFSSKKSATALRKEKRQRKAVKLKPFPSQGAGAKYLKRKLLGIRPIPKKKILSVLAKLIKKIYYSLLCGSKTNFEILKKRLAQFLNFGKTQFVNVEYFIADFRLGDIKWLQEFSALSVKKFLFSRVFYWFFRHGILRFLKINFYVTETGKSKNEVTFFDKFSWIYMKRVYQTYLVRSKKFRQVSRAEARRLQESNSIKTFGLLKFIPKGTGMRPLTKGIRFSTEEERKLNSYKTVLQQLLLNVASLPRTELLECLNLYHKKLENPKADKFFVKCDISDAFGSILQERLIPIIKEGLESLNLTKYLHLYEVRTVFFNKTKESFSYSKRYAINLTRVQAPKNSINIFTSEATRFDIAEMVHFLESFLKKQVFRETSHYFHQICGVPQSHTLSAVLSELYLNDLTGKHLKHFHHGENCLYRVCDDFIFITPNQKDAEEFYDVTSRGFPDYNCTINEEKMETNLPRSPTPASILHFFGFSIDVCSTEITVDYSSFNKTNIFSSITLPQGERRVSKMVEYHFRDLSFCANLFHKLTLKYKFNSLKTTQSNFFEAAEMVAIKFRTLVDTLFSHKNNSYLVKVAMGIISLFDNFMESLKKFRKFLPSQNLVRATVISGFSQHFLNHPSWYQVYLELHSLYRDIYVTLSFKEQQHLQPFHWPL